MQLIVVVVFTLAFEFIEGYQLRGDWKEEFQKSTADRVRDHGYHSELHYVETEDRYQLTMFRIPYSLKLQNQAHSKPAILLQHGILSSSDAWILGGPNDALAFLLADAGYDVWLGNARGNRYSRKNSKLSPKHPHFWSFSWHEVGIYDMPAMIDYILDVTQQPALHYVGHSQGTTVFFVLMSSRPNYNKKIKTAHALAPVAFMSNSSSLLAKYTRRFIGRPNRLTRLLDTMEIFPSTMFFVEIYDEYCKSNPALAFVCSNLYYLASGSGESSGNMNMTIDAHLNETHPAGGSTTQLLHYMQEYESGRFCQLDHGERENLKKYGSSIPPDNDLTHITTSDLFFYYGDADALAAVADVEQLASLLPKRPTMYRVPDPTFAHKDFLWSICVKEVINERIINGCNSNEENSKRL